MKVPVFVPTWPLPQKARRGGVLGCVIALQTPLQFRYPRRGACARKVPTRWLNCALLGHWRAPSGRPRCGRLPSLSLGSPRRGGGAALKCAARLPNDGSAAFPLAALAWCVAFPQRRLRGLPTPAPDWFVPCFSQKLPLLVPSGAGRGLKVCSSCRRCVLRASNGFPARSGATRSAKPPKTERGGSVPNEFAPNLPRSVFRLRRASPPILCLCPQSGRGGAQAPRRWWSFL